jgi:hypothetical protein
VPDEAMEVKCKRKLVSRVLGCGLLSSLLKLRKLDRVDHSCLKPCLFGVWPITVVSCQARVLISRLYCGGEHSTNMLCG